MRAKLQTPEGKALYAKRKYTVEPVFGTIKAAIGFRQFLLRGLEKVSGEWALVCLAYNCKRLHRLKTAAQGPTNGPVAASLAPKHASSGAKGVLAGRWLENLFGSLRAAIDPRTLLCSQPEPSPTGS